LKILDEEITKYNTSKNFDIIIKRGKKKQEIPVYYISKIDFTNFFFEKAKVEDRFEMLANYAKYVKETIYPEETSLKKVTYKEL
jgi:hypothetical protein